MELVNIDQLRPGFVVASAVTNCGGATLVPMGYQLTPQSIERLANAGVSSVVVEAVFNPTEGVDRRLDALDRRFSGTDDPLLLQIKAAVAKRLQFMKLGEV